MSNESGLRAAVSLWLALIAACAMLGCSRRFHRRDADAQTQSILAEKDHGEAYDLPAGLSAYPDPRSRFADPSPVDCPRLPSPIPQLSGYRLPTLRSGDPTRQDDANLGRGGGLGEVQQDASPSSPSTTDDSQPNQPPESIAPGGGVPLGQLEPHRADQPVASDSLSPRGERFAGANADAGMVRPAVAIRLTDAPQEVADGAAGNPEDEPPTGPLPPPAASGDPQSKETTAPAGSQNPPQGDVDAGGLRIVPIPKETWDNIPDVCLPRMLEFASVRSEYRRSYGNDPPADMRSDAPRLSLPNVMELALINSREYQTQKEQLYLTALALTEPRYEFLLRPTPFGNGTALNYNSLNINDTQINTLSIPTGFGVAQTTATAGQFLASFANSVVLTFNGPQGFASTIGSELLFDFQQTLFQRDIQFEQLTQAERDVVYASRSFIRFRRQLFRDLANQYYDLLLSYRAIEIASQDYFSNLRGYLQGQAEYEFRGGLPRVQVDQFEQNALRSRSDLVSRCNQLETQLDRLKLSLGLPPEMELNLDLAELEALSASDESTVARELISRARRELLSQQRRGQSDLTTLINAATVLLNRIEDIRRLADQMAEQQSASRATDRDQSQPADPTVNDERAYRRIAAMLAVLEAKSRVDALVRELESNREELTELLALQRFGRNVELSGALLELARRLTRFRRATAEDRWEPSPEIAAAADRVGTLSEQLQSMEAEFVDLQPADTVRLLPQFVDRAERLRESAEEVERLLATGILPPNRNDYAALVDRTVESTLELADVSIARSAAGLEEVNVEPQEAMLTALYSRLDLKNNRGALADSRRGVKIAADDLRSILDLRATHILRTPGNRNRPFSFGFDDSETRLSMALDTPLNRRLQRNNYRAALIDYNRAIRTLIEAEDNIKFAIRDDLRRLRLRRNQYEIGVKSAALAYERVFSTRLQLQLATGNVVARDFLEAQQAYTAALSRVASEHIAFILDRVELFFDMEAIRLDQLGYWPGLLDEEMQPPVQLNFFEENPRPYGRLAPRLQYSEEILNTVR